ncbi:MAG: hypothetical protein KF745_14005 [Phycisphaeraceae bacterium]|nr:hypothetical protein [Phycisphaeraceae bacterium]
MGLFSRKPAAENGATPPEAAPSGAQPEYSPEKAVKFFERARTVHDTTNYEYAMQLWLQGLRFQPTNIESMTGFFESAAAFLQTGAKRPSKEVVREFSGRTDIDRFLAALLAWGTNPSNGAAAVTATTTAGNLGLVESVVWLGERAIAAAGREKKPNKRQFLQLFETLGKFGAYEKAVMAGEIAVRLDPTDSRLAADVRNMAAQQTMSKGGYTDTGKEGGFRANIRDSEKQKRLEEEERAVKTEETLDRLVAVAKEEYEARPMDKPSIKRYVDRLRERGTRDDIKAALDTLSQAYKQTQDFRFRQEAGDIQLRILRRRLATMQAEAAKDGSPEAKATFEKARDELATREIEEFKLRAQAYPTDLPIKFELGRRLFDAGRFEESIGLFQEAKADGKNRARALQYLGMAFQRIGWHDEAIATFHQALEGLGSTVAADSDAGLDLRYGLMCSLQARAEEQGDPASAEEAYKLASAIAIQQISYRDIRTRKDDLKALVGKIKQGG